MTDEADHRHPGDPDAGIGSLAEETAKLVGALSGWAREHAGSSQDGMAGLAGHAAAAAGQLGDHLATGSAECTICPLCRTVHALRRLSPEVREHLSTAASSLAQAAAAVMATPAPAPRAGGDEVEHVDVDADWPED